MTKADMVDKLLAAHGSVNEKAAAALRKDYEGIDEEILASAFDEDDELVPVQCDDCDAYLDMDGKCPNPACSDVEYPESV